jgi:hypothetical protein
MVRMAAFGLALLAQQDSPIRTTSIHLAAHILTRNHCYASMVVIAVRKRGKLLFRRATLRQAVLRPSSEVFVATVILSLQVFFGAEISLLTNFGGRPVTSKTTKPGKQSGGVKDREKLTAKTSGGGPKKGEPIHAGGRPVNPTVVKPPQE